MFLIVKKKKNARLIAIINRIIQLLNRSALRERCGRLILTRNPMSSLAVGCIRGMRECPVMSREVTLVKSLAGSGR